MVLNASLLNTQHSKVLVKSKGSNPEKGEASSSKPSCSRYWKREPTDHPRLRSAKSLSRRDQTGLSICKKRDIFHTPHLTSEYGTMPRFRWVQMQGRSPDIPDEHKNASGPVRHQTINLAPPRRVRTWVNGLRSSWSRSVSPARCDCWVYSAIASSSLDQPWPYTAIAYPKPTAYPSGWSGKVIEWPREKKKNMVFEIFVIIQQSIQGKVYWEIIASCFLKVNITFYL